jgi:hypothetical protein
VRAPHRQHWQRAHSKGAARMLRRPPPQGPRRRDSFRRRPSHKADGGMLKGVRSIAADGQVYFERTEH